MKAFFSAIAGSVCGGGAYYTFSQRRKLLGAGREEFLAANAVQCAVPEQLPPFSPQEFRSFPLISSYEESPDTKVLRFAFPDGDQRCNMDLASCLAFRYKDKDGKDVIRPYTPISRWDQKGYFEVMVKKYANSKMGTHLHNLKVGDAIEAKGPFMKYEYKPGVIKHFGMIAAGSGITPMYQLLREVLKEASAPDVNLIYCNKRKEDVCLGNELNTLMEQHHQFSPYFVLEHPPKGWMGGIGHINKAIVKATMPAPSRISDSVIMVCGPPGFMEAVCGDKDFGASPPTQGELKGMLKELGYSSRQVYKF